MFPFSNAAQRNGARRRERKREERGEGEGEREKMRERERGVSFLKGQIESYVRSVKLLSKTFGQR